MMENPLVQAYPFVKQVITEEGFGNEVEWQANLSFDSVDQKAMINEIAWVIISSGMKERVVRKSFTKLVNLFLNWEAPDLVLAESQMFYEKGLAIFNNPGKIQAIIDSMAIVYGGDFSLLKGRIRRKPIETLQMFPYIGPVTSYHLAKNIGLQLAKPDRHLMRIAAMVGYDDVQSFCYDISRASGDSIPVVDIVFWRFATIEPDYLLVLKSLCVE